jgi:type IX secretion system PorP/SprF family membrane protein
MWKKFKYAILWMLLGSSSLWAQQDPQFTQYMFNNLVYNPAFAGTVDNWQFTLFNRSQWINSGYSNAPVTQTFSANTPLTYKDNKMGAGINIINDKIGIERNLSILGSYAYHLNLKKGTLSFGMQLGIRQYRINQSDINAYDKDDPIVNQGIRAPILPEVGIGFLYKTEKWYAGFSSMHLTQSKIKYTNDFAHSRLLRHFYLTGGYTFTLHPDWKLKPSAMMNFVNGAPFQGQLTVMGEYKEMVWLGVGYRSGAATTFNVGVNADKISEKFKEKIKIGYSFDWTMISAVPGFSNSGSHEIFIIYELSKKEQTHIPKFKRLE